MQIVRLVWIGLLTAVFLSTLFLTVSQLIQPVQMVEGILVALTESRPDHQSATYILTLRTNQGHETAVWVRNNGRILHYLLSLSVAPTTPITIEQQRGTAVTLQTADITIREAASPLISLVVAFLTGLITLLLLRPRLLER